MYQPTQPSTSGDLPLRPYQAANRIRIAADLDKVHTRQGDLVASELEDEMMAADAPAEIVDAYVEHASGRKALVFTQTVKMAALVAEAFREEGIAAEALSGKTPEDERRAILARLATGETQVVCNCAVLTEGFDEPSISCIVIARPTKSRLLYTQIIGRGTRKHPMKSDCLVLDVVGATRRHQLITTPSLFGLPAAAVASAGVAQAAGAQAEAEEEAARRRGNLIVTPVDLFAPQALNWVEVNATKYALPVPNGVVTLEMNTSDLTWSVYAIQGREHVSLIVGTTMEFGQGIAEDFARKMGAGALMNPKARWRRQPASRKQRSALTRFGVVVPDEISKGEASDLLSTLIAAKGGRRSA